MAELLPTNIERSTDETSERRPSTTLPLLATVQGQSLLVGTVALLVLTLSCSGITQPPAGGSVVASPPPPAIPPHAMPSPPTLTFGNSTDQVLGSILDLLAKFVSGDNGSGASIASYVPSTQPPWWLLPVLGMLKKLFTALVFGDVVLREELEPPSPAVRAQQEPLKLLFLGLSIVAFIADVRTIRAALAVDVWIALTQVVPVTLATSANVPALLALQGDVRIRNDLAEGDVGRTGNALLAVLIPLSTKGIDGLADLRAYNPISYLAQSLPSRAVFAQPRLSLGLIHTSYLYFLTGAYAVPLTLLAYYNLLGCLGYLLMVTCYLLWAFCAVGFFAPLWVLQRLGLGLGFFPLPPLSLLAFYPFAYLLLLAGVAHFVAELVTNRLRADAIAANAAEFGVSDEYTIDALAPTWRHEFVRLVLYPPILQLLTIVTLQIWLGDPQPATHTVAPRSLGQYTGTLEAQFGSFGEGCTPLALLTFADDCAALSAPAVVALETVWRLL